MRRLLPYWPFFDICFHLQINDINERKEQLLKLRQEALITKQKLEKIRSESESVSRSDFQSSCE